jgi:hypothetical protein
MKEITLKTVVMIEKKRLAQGEDVAWLGEILEGLE